MWSALLEFWKGAGGSKVASGVWDGEESLEIEIWQGGLLATLIGSEARVIFYEVGRE